MAARLTRAKKKIAMSAIPYHVPAAAELSERVDAVLDVVHFVFTTGHTAPSGGHLVREDLTSRALQLARMLRELFPIIPACRASSLSSFFADARRDARLSRDGALILLEDQDRSQWDHDAIERALVWCESR